MDSKIQIDYTDGGKQSENSILFDIKGEKNKGLNKSIEYMTFILFSFPKILISLIASKVSLIILIFFNLFFCKINPLANAIFFSKKK